MEKRQFKMFTSCLLFTASLVLLEIQLSQSCSVEPCSPAETHRSKVAAAVGSALLGATGLDADDVQDRVKTFEEEKRQSDENVNRRLVWMMAHLRKPNSR